ALKQIADGPEVPDDISQRLEMLALGCVEPKLQHADAVLLSEDFPIEFHLLTNAINKLTGAGRVLGKPNASGKTKKSEPHGLWLSQEAGFFMKCGPTCLPQVF
ncbi:MAG: hypothetical protein KAU22_05705, partial [Desulfuromonadales bacterium]|nr:hypothetical protein [Desulfuromonadales bacterium]